MPASKKIIQDHGDDFRRSTGDSSSVDIESYIYRAIKNPDQIVKDPNGGTRYYAQLDEMDKPIRVVVGSNGFIVNAFPDSGAPVK